MAIRNTVRGLWKGVIDFDQAFSVMFAAIDRYIPQAWHAGAKDCGIQPSELTVEERAEMAQAIASEKGYVFGFLTLVEEGSQANGGKLGPLFKKSETWILRYKDVKNRARILACADKHLIWRLGRTEIHCSSCLRLAGKIKRASMWAARGIRPQNPPNPLLECGGWLCDCTLTVTDEPASKGPLPNLP